MSSISEAARAKIEAAISGDEVEPTGDDTQHVEGEQAPAPPETPADSGSAAAPAEPDDQPDLDDRPTEEEEAEAEAAADAAAAALPEDATDEEIETARQEARDEFYVGRYRTKEAAEAGLAEKDSTIERLFADKANLERQLREANERQEQQEQQGEPESLDLPAWEQWAADAVEGGAGERGAMEALREGGYDGYRIYARHWLASEDPQERAAALDFNNEVIMQVAEVRAAAAAERARAQPSASEESEQAARLASSWHTDYGEYSEKMTEIASSLSDEDASFLRRLANDGVEGKARALEHLYFRAKAASPPAQKTETAEAIERRRRKASADAATLAATTPTAEGTTSRTPPPSAAEQAGIDRKKSFRQRQSLKLGDGYDPDE